MSTEKTLKVIASCLIVNTLYLIDSIVHVVYEVHSLCIDLIYHAFILSSGTGECQWFSLIDWLLDSMTHGQSLEVITTTALITQSSLPLF